MISGHRRKKSSEIRRRNRVRSASQIKQRCHPPSLEQGSSESIPHGLASLFDLSGYVRFAQKRADRRSADPVRRSFIPDGESPSSGAGRRAASVASISNGTRSGNDDDASSAADRRFERDFHI